MIYVIGGPSLSGKTTTRKYITKYLGISGIDTDTLRTLTQSLRPDLSVGHDKNVMDNYKNMRPTIRAFLFARSFFSEDYILEGDCINLEDILEIKQDMELKALFLGYPNSSVEDLLLILQGVPRDHWSREIDKAKLYDKLKEFIDYSKFLQAEASKFNLPFIDISSRENINFQNQSIMQGLGLFRD